MQIEYKPLEQVLKEANESLDKDLLKYPTKEDKEWKEQFRVYFVKGWLEQTYVHLCLQIDKANALDEANSIISK